MLDAHDEPVEPLKPYTPPQLTLLPDLTPELKGTNVPESCCGLLS